MYRQEVFIKVFLSACMKTLHNRHYFFSYELCFSILSLGTSWKLVFDPHFILFLYLLFSFI